MRDAKPLTLRELLMHAAIVAVIVAVLFPGTVTRGEVAIAAGLLYEVPPWSEHVPDDYEPVRNEPTLESVTQFSAWYLATREAFDANEWPLWFPYAFTGVPLLANYQSAPLYPPHVLTALIDIPTAMTIYVLLKLWLCGMFAYLCARGLGLGLFPAQFASLGWMLGGYVQVWTYWAEVDVVAWLPLLLLSADWLARGLLRRGFALMTLSATMLLIAGHPETALVVSVGVAGYLFIRMAQLRRRVLGIVGAASAAWAIALAVNAAQILPFLEYLANSHTFSYRAIEEAEDYYVPNTGFIAMFAPKFFGFTADGNYWGERNSNFVHIVYLGIPVWLAAAAAWAPARSKILRSRATALAAPAFVSYLLAFEIPVLSMVHELPVLSSAWEIHALSFAAFGLPLLGAIGLQAWFDEPRTLKQLTPIAIAAGFVLVVLYMAYWTYGSFMPNRAMGTYAADQVRIALFLCLGTGILFARHLFGARAAIGQAAIVVFLVVDLLLSSGGMRPTIERRDVFRDTGLTHMLASAEEPLRVGATPTGAAGNTYPNFRIEQLYGYDGIFPARIKHYINELAPTAWSRAEPLLSVSPYLYIEDKFDGVPESFPLEYKVDGVEVRRNARSLLRARLVGPVERFATPEDVMARIRDEDFDGAAVALLEIGENAKWPVTETQALGSARIVDRTPNSVRVEVNATEPCTLVLSDAFYPGWHATVDGERVPIAPAYAFARAVPVKAGEQVVQFTYKPASFTAGFWISITGMLFGIVTALILLRRARRA